MGLKNFDAFMNEEEKKSTLTEAEAVKAEAALKDLDFKKDFGKMEHTAKTYQDTWMITFDCSDEIGEFHKHLFKDMKIKVDVHEPHVMSKDSGKEFAGKNLVNVQAHYEYSHPTGGRNGLEMPTLWLDADNDFKLVYKQER